MSALRLLPRHEELNGNRMHERSVGGHGGSGWAQDGRPADWLDAPSSVAALAGGVVVAADPVMSLPPWLAVAGLVAIMVGAAVVGVSAWRESRTHGSGL